VGSARLILSASKTTSAVVFALKMNRIFGLDYASLEVIYTPLLPRFYAFDFRSVGNFYHSIPYHFYRLQSVSY
jgi:hypothetical protein